MNVYVYEESSISRGILKERLDETIPKNRKNEIFLRDVQTPSEIIDDATKYPGPHLYFVSINNDKNYADDLISEIRQHDVLGNIVLIYNDPSKLLSLLTNKFNNTLFAINSDHAYNPEFKRIQRKFREMWRFIDGQLKFYENENRFHENIIEIETGDVILKINIDDIVYAEKIPGIREVRIVTVSNEYVIKLNLVNIKNKLPQKNFFNDFQSYVINLNRTEGINFKKGEICFGNFGTLSVGLSSMKKLKSYLRTNRRSHKISKNVINNLEIKA